MPASTLKEHGRSKLPHQLEEEPRDSELVGPTEPIRDASSRIAAAMLGEASPSTGEHSEEVVLVAAELCDRLGLEGEERENVLVAARLHDVGKIAIPREILDKPRPLSDAEWALVREHTATGERILRSIGELVPAAALVRHSHEHFDGSGYPDRLSGEQIPLGSRIILCADAFHAIRSDRPYKQGRTTRQALREMKRCAGSQFDPAVVDALLEAASAAPRSARGFRMSKQLALLLAMLALGGGGAYAAGGKPGKGGSAPENAAGQGSSKPGNANGGGKLESKPGNDETQAGSKPGNEGNPPAGGGGSKPGKAPPGAGNAPPGQLGETPGRGGTTPGPGGGAPGQARVGPSR